MKEFYKIKKGVNIYFSPKFHQHNQVTEEVIRQILMESEAEIEQGLLSGECVLSKDCHAVMGVTHCIECEKSPYIYFKQRGDRPYLSRMLRGALPVETSYVTIVLRTTGPFSMSIITAWVGKKSEPELGNITYFEKQEDPQKAIAASADFWMKHALIEENPSAEELYLDLSILAGRLKTTIDKLSHEELMTILEARLACNLPACVSECSFRDEESIVQWLDTEIIPYI